MLRPLSSIPSLGRLKFCNDGKCCGIYGSQATAVWRVPHIGLLRRTGTLCEELFPSLLMLSFNIEMASTWSHQWSKDVLLLRQSLISVDNHGTFMTLWRTCSIIKRNGSSCISSPSYTICTRRGLNAASRRLDMYEPIRPLVYKLKQYMPKRKGIVRLLYICSN
jgi:hypothetical protein